MECILLPANMMRSNEYRRLQNVDKLFLIGIYSVHGNEALFHIDAKNAKQYIGKDVTKYGMHEKLRRLIDSGLIKVAAWENIGGTMSNVRMFEFLYPVEQN